MPRFPGPKQAEAPSIPADDGSRASLGPEAQEPNPEEPVPCSQFGTIGNATSQDDDPTPQSGDIGLVREA